VLRKRQHPESKQNRWREKKTFFRKKNALEVNLGERRGTWGVDERLEGEG